MKLIDAVSTRRGTETRRRTGVVTGLTGATCTLLLGGATLTEVPKLAAYHSPVEGDVVQVWQDGAQLLILGTVGAGTGGTGGGETGPAGPPGPPGPAGPAGSGYTRTTVSVTTATLATNASDDVTATLAVGYRLLRIDTSRACRVRAYTTTAKRAADTARPPGTAPTGDHGVVLDYVSTDTVLGADLSPTVDGVNLEPVPSAAIAVRVTNLAGPGTVTVTLTYIATEAP